MLKTNRDVLLLAVLLFRGRVLLFLTGNEFESAAVVVDISSDIFLDSASMAAVWILVLS